MSTAVEPQAAMEVFYSYSHNDEDLRDELERHLSVLQRSGIIQVWHDRQIDAGAEWAGQIHEHLNRANVILLLISADFLASDYCYDVEMKRAMERHQAGEAIVIPIILRPVDWSGAPFARVQCLPTDARPITSWPNRDEAFRNVAEGIRRAIFKTSQPPGTEMQERALDAAIPSTVAVGKSSELLTLVRTMNSQGLKAVLRIEESHEATEQDVQSKPFRMEFPRNSQGGLDPRVLTVRVESNDFDVAQPIKQIRVPPDGDSETCLFLVTARHAGQLAMIVEVLHEGISVASRFLRTDGAEAPQFVFSGTYRLAYIPLISYAPQATGEFTRMFAPAAAPLPPGGTATGAFPRPSAILRREVDAGPGEFTRMMEARPPVAPAKAPAPQPAPPRRKAEKSYPPRILILILAGLFLLVVIVMVVLALIR